MASIERGPPAAALAELKAYLRIEHGEEDALLAALLRAATETVEAMLGLLLFEREVTETASLADDGLWLRHEPVRSLVSVTVEGAAEPLPAGAATLTIDRDGRGCVAVPGAGAGAQIRIRYRAGMASDWSWVPDALRLAVLRAAAHFHAHRDGADDGGLPPAVRRAIGPWRTRRLR